MHTYIGVYTIYIHYGEKILKSKGSTNEILPASSWRWEGFSEVNLTEAQGLEQESKLSDELDQCLNGICPRMAVTRKHTERVRSSPRQQDGFVPESLQPTGRQQQFPASRDGHKPDTFVSAQKSSKLHSTKCLFLAPRNTSLCQTDDGTSRDILPAKIAGTRSCKHRGRSRSASPESGAAGTA